MKRFYNNKLMRFAPKGALRYIALLCVLMGVSVSVWADLTIPGNFNNWNHEGAYIQNSGTSSYSIYLNAGTYDFQINDRNGNGTVYGTNGATMYRDNCTDWKLGDKNSICKINADVSGTYTFHYLGWDNGPKISVTYPSSGAGFYTNNAISFTINSTNKKYNSTGAAEWNLSNTPLASGPKLTNVTVNVWKKENLGNICGATLCAVIDGTPKDLVALSFSGNDVKDGSTINQVLAWNGTYELPSSIGTHNIEFWIKMNANEYGTDCGSNYLYLNNGGGNYKVSYTIAGAAVTNLYSVGTAFSGWPSSDCDNTKFIALTSDANNIFSAELTGLAGTTSNNQFKFTTKQCWTNCATSGCNTTLQFYEACSPDANKMYGVAVNKDNDGNSIVTLSSGYTTPATLYVDKTKNTYWVEATKEGASSGEYFYCDMTSFPTWHQNNTVKLKATFTKTDDTTFEEYLQQCTSNTDVYVSSEVELATIKSVNVHRYGPNDEEWHDNITVNISNEVNCLKVTNYKEGKGEKFTGNCGGTGPIDTDTPLLLTYDPRVDLTNNTAVLSAYLRYTMCGEMTEYGFVYCVSPNKGGCTPTASSALKITQQGALQLGQEYSLTTPKLPDNNWYTYRAYAKIAGVTYVSDEYRDFTFNTCTQPEAGTDGLTFTVDASLGEGYSDPCTLTFGTIELAIKFLKDSYKSEAAYQYVTKDNNGSYNLSQNVIMNVRFYDDTPDDNTTAYVYKGSAWTSSAGTDKMPDGKGLALMVEDINKASSATKTLTIKGENPLLTPHVHHMLIRNSRNIILDNLHFVSDPTGSVKDNAFEIDVNSTAWNSIAIGTRANANILVQNCSFNAKGFTGVHVSGYDGVAFTNNVFNAAFDETGGSDAVGNAIDWGASAKFIACKNIKFSRNNFTGDHCTMLWIQESQNMLFMNNVFWNTNKYTDPDGKYDVPAAARLITQFGKSIQNIGFYYNTMYFADNGTTGNVSKYNFLAFTQKKNGDNNGPSSAIKEGTIEFKYNNCYSYDQDCPGKSNNQFLDKTAISTGTNYCPNNFWSVKADANFAFGCNSNSTINVSAEMCGTTALDPSMLVINGTGLNLGDKLTVEDVQTIVGTGISLTNDEVTSDRYNNAIRPEDKKWTYGAYQQKESNDVDVIIWQGDENENWDDRNNWVYLDKEGKPQPLTCLQTLSNNLKVIIPEGNSSTYPTPSDGIKYWPQLPSSFKADERAKSGIPEKEQVNTATTNKYAETIQLEYGAALRGVENLKEGQDRFYGKAIVGFTAPRSKNVMVGTIIKPNDDKNPGNYRNIKSGDYYIANHMPHVYMRRAVMQGGSTNWDEPFTSLEEEVNPERVFVINVSNQYGEYKLSDTEYYEEFGGEKLDGKKPHKYPDFVGVFADEEEPRTYYVTNNNRLFNNSYPSNLDAVAVGNVSIYSYENASWSAAEDEDIIKPQHGFILNEGTELSIDPSRMLAGGDTKSRAAVYSMPKFYLNAINATSGEEQQSKIIIKYDESHDGLAPAGMDTKKVFSDSDIKTPELYVIAYDNKYARFHTNSETQTIPLGIRLQTDMRVLFNLSNLDGFEKVVLYDAVADYSFDLTSYPNLYLDMEEGEIIGRYFLNVSVGGDAEEDDEEGGVTTDVETTTSEVGINIYTNEADNSINVVTDGVELQAIYVSDMAGKTMSYEVSGYNANLRLQVAAGVYTIYVIGDKANRTEKVILK